MKKFLAGILVSLLLLTGIPSTAQAVQYFFLRDRLSATDCTALTDGKAYDVCTQTNDYSQYRCYPTEGLTGTCDTAAEWRALSSGWTKTSSYIYPTTTTNSVGIGTTTPSAKLEVKGGGVKAELVNKTWERIDQPTYGFDTAATFNEVSAMMVRGGYLWTGYDQDTNTASSALVYRWDGTTQSYYHNFGHGAAFGAVQFLIDYKGKVYAGLAGSTAGDGDVYVLDETDTSWQLLFNNKTSTVSAPNSSSNNAISGATAFSIEWKGLINGSGENSAGRIVDKTNATTATTGYRLSTDSSQRVVFAIGEGGTEKATTTSTTISYGVPVHIVATWASGAAPKIYINGAEASYASSNVVTTPGSDTSYALTIGNRTGTADRTFHGFMSRLRIYRNIALTSGNVTTLYGNGTVAGATAEYLFTEGTGSTLADTSAAANTATITECLWDASHWSKSYDNTASQFAYSAVIYKGNLYVGSGYNNPGEIYMFDGTTWSTAYAGKSDGGLVVGLKVYNGRIFAAIGGTTSYLLSSIDGTNWDTEMSTTSYTEFNEFEEYHGNLYVNVISATNDILVRNNATATWSVSISDMPGNQCWGMEVYNDPMYIGCSRSPDGASVYKTYDGLTYAEDIQFNTLGTAYDYEAFKMINYNGSLYVGVGGNGTSSAGLWRKTDSVGQRFDLANSLLKYFRFNNANSYYFGNDQTSGGLTLPFRFDSTVGIGTDAITSGTRGQLMADNVNLAAAADSVNNVRLTKSSSTLLDNSAYAGTDEAYDNAYEAIKVTPTTTGTYGIACIQLKSASTQTNPSQTIKMGIRADNAGVPATSDLASSGTTFARWGFIGTSYTDLCISVGSSVTLTAGTPYWLYVQQVAAPDKAVTFNCTTTGTNTHAYSSNGSSWTAESSKDCYAKLYAQVTGNLVATATNAGGTPISVTTTLGDGVSATTVNGNAIRGTATATGQAATFTNNVNNSVLSRSDWGFAYLTQTIAGIGLYSPQAGSLTFDTNAPNVYITRTNTLGSFKQRGPLLRVESTVADDGNLITAYKQNVPKLIIDKDGKMQVNGTGGLEVVDASSLGSEKVTNGTFTGNATGWTLNTGWAYNSNNVSHTAGNTATMTQDTGEVAGETYLVGLVISNTTGNISLKGNLTIAIGGTTISPPWADTVGNISGNGYFSRTLNYVVRAVDTSDLTFTPSTDFNGTLDTITVKKITAGSIRTPGTIIATPPSAQTIAATNTITADACGGVKAITSAGAVTTNTTNTFTAPTYAYAGCCMDVINVGSNNITLDNNANFFSNGAADVVLGAGDTARVCSEGTFWYQSGATGNN